MKLMFTEPEEYAGEEWGCDLCDNDITVSDGFQHCEACQQDYCMNCIKD